MVSGETNIKRNQCMKLTPAETAAKIPAPNGDRFFVALERGELQIELYMPRARSCPSKPAISSSCPRGSSTGFWISASR